MLTSTVEYFKPDNTGNTFFFIDFDYGGKNANVSGVSNAYWELTREFNVLKTDFAFHAEFNAGMFRTNRFSNEINNALLLGGSYTFHSEDFSKTLSVQALFKSIQDKNSASFQITAVWGLHFFNEKLALTGFADFWREDMSVFNENGIAYDADYVFLAEPQFWFKLSDKFSVGGEVEISHNFGGHKGLMINPTLAIKWNL